MFGDNESVVTSSTVPHAKLHKRHTMLSFHRVREAVAAEILGFYHIPGSLNPADILSKHWGYQAIWPTLQPLLFWQGDTMDLFHEALEKADTASKPVSQKGSNDDPTKAGRSHTKESGDSAVPDKSRPLVPTGSTVSAASGSGETIDHDGDPQDSSSPCAPKDIQDKATMREPSSTKGVKGPGHKVRSKALKTEERGVTQFSS